MMRQGQADVGKSRFWKAGRRRESGPERPKARSYIRDRSTFTEYARRGLGETRWGRLMLGHVPIDKQGQCVRDVHAKEGNERQTDTV